MWVVLSSVCKDVAVLESRALLATKWIEQNDSSLFTAISIESLSIACKSYLMNSYDFPRARSFS
jgi:hypothetical protein